MQLTDTSISSKTFNHVYTRMYGMYNMDLPRMINQQERLHSVIECNLLTSIGVIVLASAMVVRWQDIL